MSIKIVIAFCAIFALIAADPSCIDPKGRAVDWFIALKHPGGTEYSYCDSNSCNSLKSLGHELNDFDNSPLLKTLAQIEKIGEGSDLGSLFWNDQPPGSDASLSYAHAKGFMGFNQKQGFILVHSTPRFPETGEGVVTLEIPDGQRKFGQHFFCISTSTGDLNDIAKGYLIDYPKVYDGHIPSSFKGVENLHQMIAQKRNKEDQQLTVKFESLKGVKFIKISKSGKYLVPYYETVLTEEIQAGIMVESWGSPQEDAMCKGKYPVHSNLYVNQESMEYKYTQDHSKYGISTDLTKPYVCLSDINRQTTQWKRGGGSICFNNKKVHEAFNKIMSKQQGCDI